MLCRSGGKAPCILELSGKRKWAVSFMLQFLYPWRKRPQYYWIGGFTAGLDVMAKRKITWHFWQMKPGHPVFQPTASLLTELFWLIYEHFKCTQTIETACLYFLYKIHIATSTKFENKFYFEQWVIMQNCHSLTRTLILAKENSKYSSERYLSLSL